MATTILNVPFYCLPFMLLVNLSVLSRECCIRSREALKLKNRGAEILAYLKTVPFPIREQKASIALSAMDTWHIWLHLAAKVFGPMQTSFIFMRSEACSIDVSTTHRIHEYQMEISSQHSMDLLSPYILFGNKIDNILRPSMFEMIAMLKLAMASLLGQGTLAQYSDVWWQTSAVTFYEIDLAHNVYYQYADVVISCINGDARIALPYRRTRVAPSVVRPHIAVLAETV